MITENSLANYGIDDPENKENIEMNIDTKDSKLKSKSNNSKMEISSQKIESISEAKKLYSLYKKYDDEYIKVHVSEILNPNMTISEG